MKFWQITNTFLNNGTFAIISPFTDSKFLFLPTDKGKFFPELFSENYHIDSSDSLSLFLSLTPYQAEQPLQGMDLCEKEKAKEA